MNSSLNQESVIPNNYSFNFKVNSENEKLNLELPFTEHVEELRQRTLHICSFLLFFSILAFLEIKPIVELLEIPVNNIKFFQLSPGEYFLETVKIACQYSSHNKGEARILFYNV